ncbi:patatin-like phospholipase family protein, partial [Patescibacteria group bacterium]
REGIKIDLIAGTSMGAIMAGMYASGYSLDKMKEIVMNFQHLDINPTKYLNLLHESLLKSDFVEEVLTQIFGDKKFEECKIPFTAVAVDLETGGEVFFNKGLLKNAIKASASIPIVFPPTFYEDRYLIDGGVLNNVPLSCLREQNPDVLLGVKLVNFTSKQYISGMVFAKYHQQKYKNLFKKMNFLKHFVHKRQQDLQLLAGIALRALDIASKDSTDIRIAQARPDLLIEPQVECGLLEFEKAEQAIEQGRESMEAALPKLKEILYGKPKEEEQY